LIVADPITFFVEFSSPFAQIAAHLIGPVAAKHGREIRWRPIWLAFVFKALYGDRVAQPPIKIDYIFRDARRFAGLYGIPFVKPAVFPLDGRIARRLCYRIERESPAKAAAFAKAVLQAYWGEGREMRSVEQLRGVAAGLGIADADLLAAESDEAAKAAERRACEDALAAGCFGAPYFIVDGEPFWGADRIEHIDRWLARRMAA
jgi:2-hydroxychromene-2-carboxylate isomerase